MRQLSNEELKKWCYEEMRSPVDSPMYARARAILALVNGSHPSAAASWERVERLHELLASGERDITTAIAKKSTTRLSMAVQSITNAGIELTRILGRLEESRGDDDSRVSIREELAQTRANLEPEQTLARKIAAGYSASRTGILAQYGEFHELLALMVRYLHEETSQGDGLAEEHWDGYQAAKDLLARTAPMLDEICAVAQQVHRAIRPATAGDRCVGTATHGMAADKVRLSLEVGDGKYTFELHEGDYRVHVLRYGEPWLRVEEGSTALATLLWEVDELKKALKT
jgi:hypothetical protein